MLKSIIWNIYLSRGLCWIMRHLPGYWRGFLFIYCRLSQCFCSIPFPADLSQATTLDDKCQWWSCLTTIIENYEVEVWPQQRKEIVTVPNLSTVSNWDPFNKPLTRLSLYVIVLCLNFDSPEPQSWSIRTKEPLQSQSLFCDLSSLSID